MKKLTLLFVFAVFICSASILGQARKELNFGIIGANYEIPVHKNITIAPGIGTNLDIDWLNIGVKGNYYFDNLLFGISDSSWDVYGGVNAGYSVYMGDNKNDNSDVAFGLQVGGRWFWNDKWGLYLEIGGGNVSGLSPGIGLTVKL
ncbi:hypothetical protein [Flavobacterium sp. M31R6]|uniref:hypothetical protein n=1 Tax=Flavobacterium sp. M31R6 TaxID=2739062 RepID=UPI001569F42F|nr:hypothetical protein [Flavobacterium sp. M31R6]QKJ64157.1 hypothetical protein HQN62_13790 [Flavobacterium sp. M31R6]